MAAREIELRNLQMIAVAKLRSDGLTQAQIARLMCVGGQPQVHLLEKLAIEANILVEKPFHFLADRVPANVLKKSQLLLASCDQKLQCALNELWNPHVKCREVHMLPRNHNDFIRGAALVLQGLLTRFPKMRLAGITLGGNLASIVERFADTKIRHPKLNVVPVTGDAIHLMNLGVQDWTSSSLAARLQATVNPKGAESLPSLVGVPSYLPMRLLNSGNSDLQQYIQNIPGYRKIFGTRLDRQWSGKVKGMDSLITGIGTPNATDNEQAGGFLRELMSTNPEIKRLEETVIGELGGILIPHRKRTAHQHDLFEQLQGSWTGMLPEDVRQIARHAKKNHWPGVIVFSRGGRAKKDVVRFLLEEGWVNVLVIDAELAEALQQ